MTPTRAFDWEPERPQKPLKSPRREALESRQADLEVARYLHQCEAEAEVAQKAADTFRSLARAAAISLREGSSVNAVQSFQSRIPGAVPHRYGDRPTPNPLWFNAGLEGHADAANVATNGGVARTGSLSGILLPPLEPHVFDESLGLGSPLPAPQYGNTPSAPDAFPNMFVMEDSDSVFGHFDDMGICGAYSDVPAGDIRRVASPSAATGFDEACGDAEEREHAAEGMNLTDSATNVGEILAEHRSRYLTGEFPQEAETAGQEADNSIVNYNRAGQEAEQEEEERDGDHVDADIEEFLDGVGEGELGFELTPENDTAVAAPPARPAGPGPAYSRTGSVLLNHNSDSDDDDNIPLSPPGRIGGDLAPGDSFDGSDMGVTQLPQEREQARNPPPECAEAAVGELTEVNIAKLEALENCKRLPSPGGMSTAQATEFGTVDSEDLLEGSTPTVVMYSPVK